jgi:hypothetical protein
LRTKTNRVLHRSHRWSKAEPLGLTWGRLDPSRGVVTKSGRLREVPMRQAIYDRLVALPGPREGRLWAGPEDAAGLEDFRFHDCRHHVASWFMMRGGSLQALKERLGHRDIRPLIHVHLSPSYLRADPHKVGTKLIGHGRVRGEGEVNYLISFGAEGGTRTPTPLRAHGPEPCASANSATSARAGLSSYGHGH